MLERVPVTIVLATVCLLLAGAGADAATVLAWQRDALLRGELWRLWTGHIVHFSPAHALADTLAVAATGALAETTLGPRRMAAVLLLGAPLLSVGLVACAPALAEYRGASGLAILLAVLAGGLAWRDRPDARPLLSFAACALAAKVVVEHASGDPAVAALPDGVVVAWQAHLGGALLGGCTLAIGRISATTP